MDKPTFTPEEAESFLNNFHTSPINIINSYHRQAVHPSHELPYGSTVQVFEYDLEHEPFVLKFGYKMGAFLKDKFAHNHFIEVPVPKVITTGSYIPGIFFQICERAAGKIIDELSADEFERTKEDLIATLNTVHFTDISYSSGFGRWNPEGNAHFDSWPSYLISFTKKFKFNHLLSKTILFDQKFEDKTLAEEGVKKLERYLDFEPKQRRLIHGDYGFNDVLANKGEVTGVIDWATSYYGDRLYDLAWLSFWPSRQSCNFIELFQDSLDKNKLSKPDFMKERVQACEIQIALRVMSSSAFGENQTTYQYAKEKLVGYLAG